MNQAGLGDSHLLPQKYTHTALFSGGEVHSLVVTNTAGRSVQPEISPPWPVTITERQYHRKHPECKIRVTTVIKVGDTEAQRED